MVEDAVNVVLAAHICCVSHSTTESSMENAITAILQSREALQNAVAEICSQRAEARSSFHELLTKLTSYDDTEAYLEVFERTGQVKTWPQEEWASLKGEAHPGTSASAEAQWYCNTKIRYPVSLWLQPPRQSPALPCLDL